MANEELNGITPPEEDDVIEELPSEEDTDVDWKTPAEKYQGMAQRFKTKSEKAQKELNDYKLANPEKAPETKAPEQPQTKTEFDLAEETYLLVNGASKEQIPAYWEESQKTGKSIKELMNSPYFQETLEKTTTANATPSDTKRSGIAARDNVDYWANKVRTEGEFPPNTPENFELRKKVAAALGKQDEDKGKFTSNPIVG